MKRILLALVLLLTTSLLAQQPVSVLGYSTQNTSDAAWTSATSNNTRVTLISNNGTFNAILVTLVQGTTLTGGVGTFQQSNDNSNWVNVQCVALGTTTIAGPTYTFVASTNVMFMCPVTAPYFAFQLTTVITGSGTVTVGHNSLTLPSVALMAGAFTIQAGANIIGKVTTDQTTHGTTDLIAADITKVAGTAVDANSGNKSGGTMRVVIATDQPALTQKLLVTPDALPAGSAVIGKTSVDQTTPGTTNAVESIPDTAAAVALSSSAKATNTTAVNVKASAGNVYGISVNSGATAGCWLELINSASAGTLGTAVIFNVALPNAGIVTIPPGTLALGNFSSGIAVGTASAIGGGTVCASASNVTIWYK